MDVEMTLSLDLSNPQALELFPLIFAYNYFSTRLARAVRAGGRRSRRGDAARAA